MINHMELKNSKKNPMIIVWKAVKTADKIGSPLAFILFNTYYSDAISYHTNKETAPTKSGRQGTPSEMSLSFYNFLLRWLFSAGSFYHIYTGR